MLKKLKVNKPISSEKQKALAKLEKVNAEIEKINKPIPEKLPKKKRIIREVLEPVVDFDTWSPLIDSWIKDKHNLVIIFENESNRIDIINQGKEVFRITVISYMGEEFIVSLFYTQKEMWNFKCIKVEYIKMDKLLEAIEFVYSSRGLFEV